MSPKIVIPADPTLHDVIQIMLRGFDAVGSSIGGLEGSVQSVSRELKDFKQETHENFNELRSRVGGLELKVEDMNENLEAALRAIDTDAVTLIDHERRIGKLEASPV